MIGHSTPTQQTTTLHPEADTEALVRALAADMHDLCLANEVYSLTPEPSESLKIFFAQEPEPFDLTFYLIRLARYADCSDSSFIGALVYVDRVRVLCRGLSLTALNCHRVLATALLLVIKFFEDEIFTNAYYAQVFGLPLDELNRLEIEMLQILNWKLHIAPDAYRRYSDALLSYVDCADDW